MPSKRKKNEVTRPLPLAVTVFRELKQVFADLRRQLKEILHTRRRHVS